MTVHCQQPVSEVGPLLLEQRVSGAPMVSHDGRLMGVVSITDITRFHAYGGTQRADETMVFEIGTPEAVTIGVHASLHEAAKLMVEHQVHRIVVVEGDRPVGIVSTFDIVSRVASGDFSSR